VLVDGGGIAGAALVTAPGMKEAISSQVAFWID